jgi:hypothetical protein
MSLSPSVLALSVILLSTLLFLLVNLTPSLPRRRRFIFEKGFIVLGLLLDLSTLFNNAASLEKVLKFGQSVVQIFGAGLEIRVRMGLDFGTELEGTRRIRRDPVCVNEEMGNGKSRDEGRVGSRESGAPGGLGRAGEKTRGVGGRKEENRVSVVEGEMLISRLDEARGKIAIGEYYLSWNFNVVSLAF